MKMKKTPSKVSAAIAATMVIAAAISSVVAQQRVPWGADRFNEPNPEQRYNDQRGSSWPSNRFNQRQERNVAGQFDYYALVLSWSPTYCSTSGDNDDQQCNRPDGRRFSFIVHGLWPQYEKGYPEMCRTERKPYVPQPLIDKTLDIMPSGRLIIHEYRKHGTCSGLSPEGYFSTARKLFNGIRIPDRFKNPFEQQFASPAEVVRGFVQANPDIQPDMMAVSCGGAGNRLKEIRFCFTRDGKPRSCGANEDQRRMCNADRMFIPPVRSTARDDYNSERSQGAPSTGQSQQPIPRPRLIEGPKGI